MLIIYSIFFMMMSLIVAVHSFKDAPRTFNLFSKIALFISAFLFSPIFVIYHYYEQIKKQGKKS